MQAAAQTITKAAALLSIIRAAANQSRATATTTAAVEGAAGVIEKYNGRLFFSPLYDTQLFFSSTKPTQQHW